MTAGRRALLDVNVLIALLDQDHIHHYRARDWVVKHGEHGWASCPITQNGCVRVISNPSYPNATSTADAIRRLQQAVSTVKHEFWPDSVSLFHPKIVNWKHVLTSRTITDAYLLALAVKNNGRFVTFDQAVHTNLAPGATSEHLVTISI